MKISTAALAVGAILVSIEVAWVAYALHDTPERVGTVELTQRPDDFSSVDQRLLSARPAQSIRIDGVLDDWSSTRFLPIVLDQRKQHRDAGPHETPDLSARIAAAWSDAALYIALEVHDDIHLNDRSGRHLWRGDSIQLAFDVGNDGGPRYDGSDDFEFGWALTDGGLEYHRWAAPKGSLSTDTEFEIRRIGSRTVYEIRIPASALELSELVLGETLGFSIAVHDDDGRGPKGVLQWTPGIIGEKNPDAFGEIQLLDFMATDPGP